jgi:hypothetical protein
MITILVTLQKINKFVLNHIGENKNLQFYEKRT